MSPPPKDLLLFVLSAGLLLTTAHLVARRLARDLAELFWLLTACVSLQLGALASGLSLGGWMTPRWWLAGQVALLAAVILWTRSRPHPEPLDPARSVRAWWISAPRLARGTAAIAVLFVVFSGLRQAAEPISGFDDRMYHGSRVAYWMQNASVLPYPTHNERQVAFPFGSELYFLWPVLLTRSEAVGRLVFWLGYPAAAVGVHLLAGRAGAREPFRSLATLLFVSTPIVNSLSIGLAPESWLTVFEAGTAFWILEAARPETPERSARASGWAGLLFVLALNVKTTAAGLVIPLAVLLLAVARPNNPWSLPKMLLAGAFVGFLLSGLALNAVGNFARCGNPFASAGLRQIHRSDLNPRQLFIHAVRLPFVLFELPWLPDPVRQRLETVGETVAARLGATRTISLEDAAETWPGRFHFRLQSSATRYSLGGLFWLLALAYAPVLVLREFRRSRREARRSVLFLSTVVAWGSLLPVLFGLRWMAGSGVPMRFLVAPWTLGAVLLASLASRHDSGSRGRAGMAAFLVAFQVVPSLESEFKTTRSAVQSPLPDAALDEPFANVVPKLPPGSRVLLFADQDTRDYPLFRPREGFPNTVIAWGNDIPTIEAVSRRTLTSHATHVLFVSDEWLTRHWDPAIRIFDVIAAMRACPDFQEVAQCDSPFRLFDVLPSAP